MKKEKYSWAEVFDWVKLHNGSTGIVDIKSKRKFVEPETPRNIKGYALVYAQYIEEKDAVKIWAYTGNSDDWYDTEDEYCRLDSMREKWQGLRNRLGEWIEPFSKTWD